MTAHAPIAPAPPLRRGLSTLHVCETARGGIASYFNLLHLAETGMARPRFVVPDRDRGLLDGRARTIAYRAPRRSGRALAAMTAALMRAVRDERPDIVFLHSSFTLGLLPALRLALPGAALLYCAHGWARHRCRGGLSTALTGLAEGRLSRLADRVVNVSHAEARLAERAGYGGAPVVIETGLPDRPMLARRPHEGIRLLFAGRFARQKGLDVLLPAFAAARARRPDLELHLLGDGAPLAPVPGVVAHGWVGPAAVEAHFRDADLVVVPSRWEGLPLVVPEALRAGTPVLVSDRAGLPELIEAGRSGLVSELTSTALCNHLSFLTKHGLEAMRPAARARYESRFGIARFRAALQALYDEVAPPSRARALLETAAEPA